MRPRPGSLSRIALPAALGLLLWGCSRGGAGPASSRNRFHEIPAAGSVDLGDVRAPYVVEGAGRPCLVVGSRIYYPKTFSDRFKEHFRCAFLDLRAFIPGAPPPAAGRFGIETAVRDIESARRQLGLDSFVLVGHSIHGLMAVAYAQRYPGNAGRVIAIGAPPAFDENLAAESERFWESDASGERKSAHARNLREAGELQGGFERDEMVRQYVAYGAMYWFDPTYDAGWLWEGVETNPLLTAQIFDPVNRFDLRDGPTPIHTPVLLALGRYDYVVPYTLWDPYLEILPDHHRVIFTASGHTPQLEQPRLFDETVIGWVGPDPPAPRPGADGS